MPPVLLAINKSKITFLQVYFVLLNYEVPEVKDRVIIINPSLAQTLSSAEQIVGTQ